MWKFWKTSSNSGPQKGLQDDSTGALSRADALASVPVPNAGVEVMELSESVVRLRCPMVYAPWIRSLSRLVGSGGTPQMKTIELDELGTTCWKLIDGDRSVQDIIHSFAEHYSLHRQEAHVAVTAFMRDLGKRGLIVMRSPS